jgi:hypothetical protein
LSFSQYYIIEGTLVDDNNKPIELAEVLLLQKDSTAIASQLSDEKGAFVIQAVPATYILLIRAFSKTLLVRSIDLTKNIHMGLLKVENSVQLNEITVTVKNKWIERKVDRLVFHVENLVSAAGGDALDALKVTPSLRVQNDQISMIGKSGMTVLINDKLMQLTGDDLTNFLKNIKSADIQSIEVFSNPPAKYDAAGNSGIVNIKLKKAQQNSVSGKLQSSYTQAKYASGSLGGGLNYQKDKWTVVSNFNYGKGSMAPYQEYTLDYPAQKWFEKNQKRNFQNNLSGMVTLDYQWNPQTVIGVQYSGALNQPIRQGANHSYITNKLSHEVDSLISTPSRSVIVRNTHAINFHTLTQLDTMGKQISLDADYFGYKTKIDNEFSTNTYLANGLALPNRFLSANNLSYQNIQIYSAKIDVDIPLKWFNLTFGGKISHINNRSEVQFLNTTRQPAFLDSTKSNTFDYKEQIQALYFSGTKSLSKTWDLQAGLRLETTQTQGNSETLHQTHTNHYVNLFPTLFLTYKRSEENIFAMNYNRRIDRPNYRNLNPFRFYSSAYNYSEGNPLLTPFFTHNIDLSHTYKNLYTSIYGFYLNDGIDEVTFVSGRSTVQTVIPYNFFTQKTIGIMENYTFNKWKWLESNNQWSVYFSETASRLAGSTPTISRWTASFNSNNSFNINSTIKAELNGTYQSASLAGSYVLNPFYYWDAGVKILLRQKKLQIAINVYDIFRTYEQTFVQYINGIKTQNYDYNDAQKIRFSLTYHFGKSLKIENREQSNKRELDRL